MKKQTISAAVLIFFVFLLCSCDHRGIGSKISSQPEASQSLGLETEFKTSVSIMVNGMVEQKYLMIDNGTYFIGTRYRAADFDRYFIYRIPIKHENGYKHTITHNACGQYRVSMSTDGKDWYIIDRDNTRYSFEQLKSGYPNTGNKTIDITSQIKENDQYVYIKFCDNFEDDSFGVQLSDLKYMCKTK